MTEAMQSTDSDLGALAVEVFLLRVPTATSCDREPPVGAFSSATMYDNTEFFLVDNPAAGPRGGFRPILRMYEPDSDVFDGGYDILAVRKIN